MRNGDGVFCACLLAFTLAPEHGPMVRALSNPQTYARIGERLLPDGGWFRPALAGPVDNPQQENADFRR